MSVSTVNEKENLPAAYGKEDFLRDDFHPAAMQKIVQEGILLAGGALAILLQVASPGVGAGVNEHSNFAYRVQDRLRTTLTYVYCMGFGTPNEKRAIVEMIHKAHAPVTGTLADGTTYKADDPDLQLWVAATLYATGLDVYQRVFGPVPEAEADQMYREYSIVASSLKVPPEMWPRTRADFWEYWDRMIATLEITDHARSVARDLLSLKNAPLKFRVLMPFVRLTTVEWMPERIREGYGLKVSRRKHAFYKVNEALVRAIYPALPMKLRTYPVKHYLADMRHRLAKMGSVVDKEAKIVPH
ncbi:hypothetical protein GQ53DRAFT_888444 [Thozetella sp. PMI_491]|nr:hypothetical protein GQ53DRAFT_888444 [Thozetella sp. PMI_491]